MSSSSSSSATNPPLIATHVDEHHPYLESSTSCSSSSSSSSSCSSPNVQQQEYRLLSSKARRKKRAFISDEKKDPIYWSQRSKNNLSAKRSRVKRRMNDLVLETKLTQLSNENEVLRAKIDMLARKFGDLNDDDDDEDNTSKETDPMTVLDRSMSSLSSKPNSSEERTLIEKKSTVDSSPSAMQWCMKLFQTTSNS